MSALGPALCLFFVGTGSAPPSIGGDLNIRATILESVSELGALSSIGGDLSIAYNPKLPNLAGLDALTTVGGSLTLLQDRKLSSVTALYGLPEVGLDVDIEDNIALATADADALVAEIDTIGGTVTVDGNAP